MAGCVSCAQVPLALAMSLLPRDHWFCHSRGSAGPQGWLRNKPQFGLFDLLKSYRKFQNITGSIKQYSSYSSARSAAQVTRPREESKDFFQSAVKFLWDRKIWLKESHQSHQQLYHPLPLNSFFQLQKAELTFKQMKHCTLKRKTTFRTSNNLMEA